MKIFSYALLVGLETIAFTYFCDNLRCSYSNSYFIEAVPHITADTCIYVQLLPVLNNRLHENSHARLSDY